MHTERSPVEWLSRLTLFPHFAANQAAVVLGLRDQLFVAKMREGGLFSTSPTVYTLYSDMRRDAEWGLSFKRQMKTHRGECNVCRPTVAKSHDELHSLLSSSSLVPSYNELKAKPSTETQSRAYPANLTSFHPIQTFPSMHCSALAPQKDPKWLKFPSKSTSSPEFLFSDAGCKLQRI